MRVALVLPGGVDRSLEYKVIPALLAFINRLTREHEVEVFALHQEKQAGDWPLLGAHINNIGSGLTTLRAIRAICAAHRVSPFSIVHAIFSGACGSIAVASAKLLGIPSLVHIAGGELASLPEIGYGGRLKLHSRLRESFNLRYAQAVTAASEPMIEMLAMLGVTAHRVPLGVDLSAWPPRSPVRRDPRHAARLIHVASLNAVKDQTTLLGAVAELKRSGASFELDIVGEDTLRGKINSLASELSLTECVKFRGFLTHRELRPLLEAADLMVLSSLHEAGPLAMLEAAVVGVPTVGTAVGHIQEWSPDAAIAVPTGDPISLARAVGEVLCDEELRLSLAANAMRRAVQDDADATAIHFQTIYNGLVGSRN